MATRSPAPTPVAQIHDVSDTARWVAHLRALESERPDAIFHDPFARRLAGDRGKAIAERLPTGPLSWSLAVRTKVFDELILSVVGKGDVPLVLSLGGGLDARPYRLALPADLRWIEVDLPGILAWKSEVLAAEAPRCSVERVGLDLADRAARRDLFDRLGAASPRALIVTEGLLVYLDEATVRSLADDLHRAFPAGSWILENVAPVVLERQRRMWNEALGEGNAEMKFAAEGLDFFRPHGFAPAVVRSLLEEAQRLGREMPFAAVMRFFAKLTGRQEKFRKAVEYAVLSRLPRP